MQSFVSLVNKDNYQQFIENQPTKYKVLLFTERKTTAPIFKALSKQFKDKLLFGEVRKNSESELIAKFGVTQFPTLLVITDPHTNEGEKYEGELKHDRLTKFLNNYSYKTASYEKKLDFIQLSIPAYRQQSVCSKRSSNMCFIFFTSSNVQKLLLDQLRPLLDKFKSDPITLTWVDKHEESELHQQFGESKHHLIAYKPKRGTFLGYKSADFAPESIGTFISDVLGGSGQWTKIQGDEIKLKGMEAKIKSRDDL